MPSEQNSVEENSYRCPFISEPIKIDGLLDEPAWKKAKPLSFIVPVTFENAASETEARLLWDREYLYVSFKAYDKDIWSYYTQRDDPTCQEDVLEVFFKTDPQEEPYYNFEINALGTVYDAYNLRRQGAGGGHRWSRWNCEGLKVGVHIEGTLNNPEDEDEYWQL
ncbi:MAG: carbohydrate-binding family 9-like protein, partial [Candidatus Latescibacteria bacterium]|nr:carbohydrate-binding family 9-like protein [Candidatus Latescibacterota bacterium]